MKVENKEFSEASIQDLTPTCQDMKTNMNLEANMTWMYITDLSSYSQGWSLLHCSSVVIVWLHRINSNFHPLLCLTLVVKKCREPRKIR